jgi:uncharacterized repeat protein (TIGR01451 family)
VNLRNRLKALRRYAALGMVTATVAAGLTVAVDTAVPAPASAAQDPTACVGQIALTNGSFEQPAVAPGTYRLFAQSLVPGWRTTDSLGQIELWGSGFNRVPAAGGNGFAELNANSPSRLYQDVATTPGQTLSWSLKHRGRSGTDVMRVLIGSPTGALVQSGTNLSDGTTAWGTHTGTYTVPAGQTVTRFAFEAVSSVGGPATGNFLDEITFGTGPCLVSSKTVTNLTRGGTSAEVGDVLRYTVTTRNDGGNPALQSVSTDVLEDGVDFVPGSLRLVSGPGVGTLTDAAADDRGEYSGADRTVRVRLGDAASATAGGSVGVGTVTSYTFDARVNLSAAGGSVDNEARVAFRDAVANQNRTSVTNATVTPVGQAADLAVTKTLDTTPLIAGQPVSYTLSVTNNGPQAGTGVVVTDALPAGIRDVTVDGAACDDSNNTLTCSLPDLAVGASATIRVAGTLAADLDPGQGVTNAASVTGSRTDPQPANNTAAAAGTVTTSADVSIVKEFSPAEPIAGQNVTYTLTAHNDGPSDARDVVLTDPLDSETAFVSAAADQGTCTVIDGVLRCDIGTLAAGATAVATITVTLAPEAVSLVQNTATITTTTSDPDPRNNASSVGFEPGIIADLAVTKTASAATVEAGDPVTFTLEVTNNGPSDAVDVVLSDAIPSGFEVTAVDAPAGVTCDPTGVECTWDSLPAGRSITVAVHTTVRADAPAGTVTNTASVAAPADDRDTTNNSASVDVTVEQSADLRITKVPAPATGVPGGAQTFVVTVVNDGPSLARDVRITDPLPDGFSVSDVANDSCAMVAGVYECTVGDIAPGEQVAVTISGVIASGMTGSLTNAATTSSATPDPDSSNNTATALVPLTPTADVSVTKSTATPTVPLGGEVVYAVTVRNDGPSVAAAVVVQEQPGNGIFLVSAAPSVGTWDATAERWTVGTLLPGEEATLTVTGTATAEGVLPNRVVASSATPDPDSTDLTASADVVVTPSADLAISKKIDVSSAVVGSRVEYTITVRNDGPSVAAGVRMRDVLPVELIDAETSDPSCVITGGALVCEEATLAAGETRSYTLLATVDPATASDDLVNTATVDATTADPTPDNNTAGVTTAITGLPAVALRKSAGTPTDANGNGRVDAGDSVAYTFSIANTGPTILTDLRLEDPLLGGVLACPSLDGATLAPRGEIECGPLPYTLTQADIDAGSVRNVATVAASSPRGPATAEASANVIVPMVNSVSLAKTVASYSDEDADGLVGAGDRVTYSFTVRNTGTSTLHDAVVTDPMLGGALDCPELNGVTLLPGDEIGCGAIAYVLTQSDVDAGLVTNTASVTARSPRGDVSDDASATAIVTGTDAVELVKTAGAVIDTNGDGRLGAGDTATYSFTIRNLGTTTLNALALADPLLGGALECSELDGLELLPGQDVVCGDFSYILTQADVDAGLVHNEASVRGDGALGPVADEASADLVVSGTPEISLTKDVTAAVDATGDGRIGAGDSVDYRFTVRNTGTTALADIVLADDLLGGTLACDAFDGLVLLPGEEVECGPVTYTLIQGDVDATVVTNAATVTGRAGSSTVDDSDTVDVEVRGANELALQKSAGAVVDANGNGRTDAGDTIEYTFAVHNTGTTTVTSVEVADPRLSGSIVCERTTLVPGELTVCHGELAALTQAEIDAGQIVNTATATGVGAGGVPVSADDSIATPLVAQPAISLEKTGGDFTDRDGDGKPSAGDTVSFRFVITNSGAVTLTGVALDDPKLGGAVPCVIPDLAPGATVECGLVSYAMSAAEAGERTIRNVATVTAQAAGTEVTDAASVVVELPELAQTGGVLGPLLPWALLLVAAGAVVLIGSRVRRHTPA